MLNNLEIYLNNKSLYNLEYVQKLTDMCLGWGVRLNLPSIYLDSISNHGSIGVNIDNLVSSSHWCVLQSQIHTILDLDIAHMDFLNVGLCPTEFNSMLIQQINRISKCQHPERIRPIIDIDRTMLLNETVKILDLIEQAGLNQCILTTTNQKMPPDDLLIEAGLARKYSSIDISVLLLYKPQMDIFYKFQEVGTKSIISRPNLILDLIKS